MTTDDAHSQSEELTCVEEVELLTDYLEGALPAAEARRLEHHLESCPGCGEYLAQMRTLAGSLGGFSGDSIAPESRDRLIAAFRLARDP